jgi:hypothetical protein
LDDGSDRLDVATEMEVADPKALPELLQALNALLEAAGQHRRRPLERGLVADPEPGSFHGQILADTTDYRN